MTVTGALVANFTPDGGTFAQCEVIPFNSTSTIPVTGTTGYSWLINGKNFNTATVSSTLPPGTNLVTLGLMNTNGAAVLTDQITKSFTVTGTNHAPTVVSTGGPYTVLPGGTLALNGTGTDADSCDVAQLTYGWDVDGKAGYEFSTPNPTISYNALMKVLGNGTHTIMFKVTDPSGAFATASTTVALGSEAVRMNGIFYPSVQDAYNAAVNNDVIEITGTGGTLTGTFVFDRPVKVTIAGGFTAAFAPTTGKSVINGLVRMLSGTVIMKNISVL